MLQPLWKTAWQLFKKANIDLPYDSAFPLLGMYPRKMKTYVHTNIYTGIFIAALYIITKKVETTQMSIK